MLEVFLEGVGCGREMRGRGGGEVSYLQVFSVGLEVGTDTGQTQVY